VVKNAHAQRVHPDTDHGFDALLVEEDTLFMDSNGELQDRSSPPHSGIRYVMIHNFRAYSEEFVFLKIYVDEELKKIKVINTLVYVFDEDERDVQIYEQFFDLSSRVIYDIFSVLITLAHMDYLIDMSHDTRMDARTIRNLNLPVPDSHLYTNCSTYIRNAHYNMVCGGDMIANDDDTITPDGNPVVTAAATAVVVAPLQDVGR
jgi:hypothetical protein